MDNPVTKHTSTSGASHLYEPHCGRWGVTSTGHSVGQDLEKDIFYCLFNSILKSVIHQSLKLGPCFCLILGAPTVSQKSF